MLFEPCGVLRKDYGAYCETLRLTEREEVYSAINTTEELAQRRLERQQAALDEQMWPESGGSKAAEEAAAAALVITKAAEAAADMAEAERVEAGGKGKRESSRGSRKVPRDVEVAHPTEETFTQPCPSLTIISLRHPKFCINQRDMTPLCRAIPHCPSLVAVHFVGCGLSEVSYLLLVEALFKSPRVVTVRVDFNSLIQPGFLADPTLATQSCSEVPPESAVSIPPAPSLSDGADASKDVTETHDAVLSSAGSNHSHRKRSSSASKSRHSSRKSGKGQLDAQLAANAAPIPPDEPGAIYLKPGEFCGLHLLPTPLVEQIMEEKEKRGKVDPKKVVQLQQLQESQQQFNLAHRLKLKGWEGMLYTGVRYLCLRGNGIDDTAVRAIVSAMQHNPQSQLLSLNLWGNRITDTGARCIARLLRTNRTLRALDLGRNCIGDAGLLEIVNTFRMIDLSLPEEITSYRQHVLTRPGASEEERAAASQQMSHPLPSYADLYYHWHAVNYPPTQSEERTREGGKRANQSKSKGKSSESFIPTLARPTAPFDRYCLRLYPTGDNTVRVPGNTVLEVLSLSDNPLITLAGIREVQRRLSLNEPKDDEEMAALIVNPSLTSGGGAEEPTAPGSTPGSSRGRGHTVPLPTVYPPEAHCAGLRLRSCMVSSPRYTAEADWPEMAKLQRMITEALGRFAPTEVTVPVLIDVQPGEVPGKAAASKPPSGEKKRK